MSVDDPITLFFRTFAGKSYEVSGLFGIDGRVVVAPPPPVDPSPRDDSFRSQPGAAAPIATRFGPAYPNPSHNNLSFVLELARPGEAHVEVYDLRGAKVRTLINGNQPAGRYDLSWDGRDGVGHLLPNGLYLVRMRAGTYRATRSGLLVR